jgi:hypothetical protein
MGGSLAKKSKKSSSATEWTLMEQVFAVIIVILIIVAAYAFFVREEVVEVASIETYKGSLDLRGGDPMYERFFFDRQLKENYQVHVKYNVPDAGGGGIQPIVHFKVWNQTTGKELFKMTSSAHYDKSIRLDAEDAGYYQFLWWVDSVSGSTRVDYDVLIEPTEKLFEKKT